MKPKCVMLVGVPCSGKSTFLSKSEYSIQLLMSTDMLVETWAARKGLTYSEGFQDFIDDATKVFWKQIETAVSLGHTFVVDRTNLTPKARRQVLSKLSSEYEKIAVFFPTPPIDVLKERNMSRPGKIIPPHILESMMNALVPPTTDEGFDEVIVAERNW